MSDQTDQIPALTAFEINEAVREYATSILHALGYSFRRSNLNVLPSSITFKVEGIHRKGKYAGLGRVAIKRLRADLENFVKQKAPCTKYGSRLLSTEVILLSVDTGFVGQTWRPTIRFGFDRSTFPTRTTALDPSQLMLPERDATKRSQAKRKDTPYATAVKALRAEFDALIKRAVEDKLMTARAARRMTADVISRTPLRPTNSRPGYAARHGRKRKLVSVQKAEAAAAAANVRAKAQAKKGGGPRR